MNYNQYKIFFQFLYCETSTDYKFDKSLYRVEYLKLATKFTLPCKLNNSSYIFLSLSQTHTHKTITRFGTFKSTVLHTKAFDTHVRVRTDTPPAELRTIRVTEMVKHHMCI